MIFNLYPDDPDLQPDMIHIFYRWYTVFENRPKFMISIFTEFLQIFELKYLCSRFARNGVKNTFSVIFKHFDGRLR